ncbi:ubiquitin carboxyl-terminal hydrolase [Dendryphion nanum]|uniref:ubiquitinyl hydrolase 1 n=1 Tax=Dendryphion nanum TaxID=256645 RepID=A0A9P9IZX2_9PLEO|nr:ubiquitin carboxyl-terminal hydrolase [Dendryphion nanum]
MVKKAASSSARKSKPVANANGKAKAKAKAVAELSPNELDTNGSSVPDFPDVSNTSPKKRAYPDELPEDTSNKKSKSASGTPERDGPTKEKRFPSPPQEPANAIDKENWQGFCDIESDPDYFSVMVREMGVNGVVVREVFGLNPDTLNFTLPQPIYGLILLYRYREGPEADQEDKCPENVWFANQLPAQNSCATLAMINILMNAPNVNIGENLNEFKKFTADLKPFHRGEALASFKFVKRIHNSFAKKMDMLESDTNLALKAQKNVKGRRNSQGSDSSIEDNAHHFVAFLPVDGEVWKLDGYDCNPTAIGDLNAAPEQDWLQIAASKITEVMTSAGDGDYTVLALCKSPVARLRQEMSESWVTYQLVESCLGSLSPDWRTQTSVEDSAPCSPNILQSLGVEGKQIDATCVPVDTKRVIEGQDEAGLLARREVLSAEQRMLQSDILEQMEVESAENMKATERRWDYGPAIKVWLERLAANGYLEENLARFMPKK